jgi:hypothetical protein
VYLFLKIDDRVLFPSVGQIRFELLLVRTHVERQLAAPGTSASTFDAATGTGLNTLYSNILANFSVEPFAVNESETGVYLGKINYAPYTACN